MRLNGMEDMKKIAIIGSTGSIGTQTLEIVRKEKDICVTALAAGRNIDLLEAQVREFGPKLCSCMDEKDAEELKVRLKDLDVKVECGMDGLIDVATEPEAEVLVTGIVGMIGIRPAMAAIEAGKDVALANKETLVCAGHLIMPMAKRRGVRILPVDSEHSAIFQSLQGQPRERLEKILLTASGGPFRGRTREELENVTLEDALHHPNWTMGRKVTIDSASLCNKGLEVMEAGWLFDVEPDQIEVVIHPQSIVHSAVQYEDGSIIAQLGVPDMKLPIQYALYYPDRRPMPGERVDLFRLHELTFEKPDLSAFPGLGLAYEAIKRGGSLPTVFNAANEAAVRLLIDGRIRFAQIPQIIGDCMAAHAVVDDPDVDTILAVEKETAERALSRADQGLQAG